MELSNLYVFLCLKIILTTYLFSVLEVKYWADGMVHRVKSLLPKKNA